jgi:hypothetical protein
MYAQNAIANNEFLGHSWQMVRQLIWSNPSGSLCSSDR